MDEHATARLHSDIPPFVLSFRVPSIAAIWAAHYRMLMRLCLLAIILVTACDVFRSNTAPPKTALTPERFIEVYVAVSKARTPGEKQQVLKRHKTSEKALHEFVQAYSRDLPHLSATFDSVLARMSDPRAERLRELPR